MRLYDGNINNVNRSWVFRIEDLRQYKNVEEIMEKLALPTKPKRITLVEVPENSVLRKSFAGEQEWSNGLKQTGGGIQYEILGTRNDNWYKDLIKINEFFK